jgi:hypothetical protein
MHVPRRPRFLLALVLAGCGSSQIPSSTGDAAPGDAAADGAGPGSSLADATAADVAPDLSPDLPIDLAPLPADATFALPEVPSRFGACVINSDCANPLACVFGRCHIACAASRDCPFGSRCVKGPFGQVCLLPSEDSCETATSCPAPLVCAADHRCRNECRADVDCPIAQLCADRSACVEPTGVVIDGGSGLVVDGGSRVIVDGAMLWGLSRGKNDYRVTAVANISDGCGLAVDGLVGSILPVTYDESTDIISIGNLQGTPMMPSLGSGKVGDNLATLLRDNVDSEGPSCSYHRRDVANLTLFGHDAFTLDITEIQSMFAAQCPTVPASGSCISRWRWTLRKN